MRRRLSDNDSTAKPLSSGTHIFNLVASCAFVALVAVSYSPTLKSVILGLLTGLLAYGSVHLAFGDRMFRQRATSGRQTFAVVVGAIAVFLLISLLLSWIDPELLLVPAILQTVWIPVAISTFVAVASSHGLLYLAR